MTVFLYLVIVWPHFAKACEMFCVYLALCSEVLCVIFGHSGYKL